MKSMKLHKEFEPIKLKIVKCITKQLKKSRINRIKFCISKLPKRDKNYILEWGSRQKKINI